MGQKKPARKKKTFYKINLFYFRNRKMRISLKLKHSFEVRGKNLQLFIYTVQCTVKITVIFTSEPPVMMTKINSKKFAKLTCKTKEHSGEVVVPIDFESARFD